MFWKQNNSLHQGKYSITRRLTLFYTLSIVLIILLMGLVLYFIFYGIINIAEKQYLVNEIQIIKQMFDKNPHNLKTLTYEFNGDLVREIDGTNAIFHYYMRLLDKNRNILMETHQMEKVFSTYHFPNSTINNWRYKTTRWMSSSGKRYLLMSAPILNNESQIVAFVQIALDTSYPDEILNQYEKGLILTLIVALLLAMVTGRMIARKGLKRLYDIVAITEHITGSDVSHRLVIKDLPTELVSVGTAVNNMLARIEQAIQRLYTSSSELAHELRTPLNSLMLEAEVTLTKPRKKEEYKKIIESGLEEYRRLHYIINNILFLARAEHPDKIINYTKLEISKEIAKLCNYYQISAGEKKITLEYSGAGVLYADLILFQRALGNIVANAIRFTPEGGHIKIKTVTTSNQFIEISVIDNGIGIAEEHLNYLFDKFYRIPDSTNTNCSGIGLGLSIVKSIMSLHHGTVNIVSTLDKGTTVKLIFPKKQP